MVGYQATRASLHPMPACNTAGSFTQQGSLQPRHLSMLLGQQGKVKGRWWRKAGRQTTPPGQQAWKRALLLLRGAQQAMKKKPTLLLLLLQVAFVGDSPAPGEESWRWRPRQAAPGADAALLVVNIQRAAAPSPRPCAAAADQGGAAGCCVLLTSREQERGSAPCRPLEAAPASSGGAAAAAASLALGELWRAELLPRGSSD